MKKKISILIGILIIVCIGTILWVKTHEKEETVVWEESKTVNEPILLEGMRAITFKEGEEMPIGLKEDEMVEGIWYDYIEQEGPTENGGTSKWANAMTLDGSMWVWIPRYAYKIEWDQEQEKGKIDIMFLKGTTNYNKEGEDVTKIGYTVHPAFRNGQDNQYRNGEWDQEITGIWISKFEAGYAGQKSTASEDTKIVNTNLKYKRDSSNILRRNKKRRNLYDISCIYGKNIFL